jgi:LacI family transcriptional regulator
MPPRRNITVLIESSRGYGRGLLQGIATYVREHGPWTIHNHERRLYDAAPDWLKHWRGDGIIARIAGPDLARQISRLHVPTVDLLGLQRIQGVPAIITDHQAVSRLAADHLLSRGIAHFAFCGFSGIHFSEQRSQYFAEYLARQGRPVSVYAEPPPRRKTSVSTIESGSSLRADAMAAWLKSLPKPVGLMAATDNRGHQLLNVCGEYGIAVPDEVAVIGVDNDEMLCELCDPPLSSVALNPWKVGYEAAALLDRMIGGATPPRPRTLIPPLGVVVRRSTDVVTIPDADLAAALRLIRQRACRGIRIEDVVEKVQISRSTLKRRFMAFLRRSPQDEIHRVQIERVMHLLGTTRLPLLKIAEQAGFRHVESMCKLFKRKTGMTPGQYRKMWSEGAVPSG